MVDDMGEGIGGLGLGGTIGASRAVGREWMVDGRDR